MGAQKDPFDYENELLDESGKLYIKRFLGIDIGKYPSLPEGERKKIVNGISYTDSFGHDGAVDLFFSFVCENDESGEIRELAFGKKFPSYARGKEIRAEVND